MIKREHPARTSACDCDSAIMPHSPSRAQKEPQSFSRHVVLRAYVARAQNPKPANRVSGAWLEAETGRVVWPRANVFDSSLQTDDPCQLSSSSTSYPARSSKLMG